MYSDWNDDRYVTKYRIIYQLYPQNPKVKFTYEKTNSGTKYSYAKTTLPEKICSK